MPVEVGSSLNAPAGPDVEVAAEEQELVVARVLEDGSELRERPVHGGVGLLVQEPVEGNCRDGLVPLAGNEGCLPRARTRRLEREIERRALTRSPSVVDRTEFVLGHDGRGPRSPVSVPALGAFATPGGYAETLRDSRLAEERHVCIQLL